MLAYLLAPVGSAARVHGRVVGPHDRPAATACSDAPSHNLRRIAPWAAIFPKKVDPRREWCPQWCPWFGLFPWDE